MIKLLTKLPKQIAVAFSGGVDSLAAVNFLSRKHDVLCVYFDHGTAHSKKALDFVDQYCMKNQLRLLVGVNTATKPRDLSWEEFWRIERYKFLDKCLEPVITAHTLDDCVETYIFSALHGSAKTIPLQRNRVVRPFLTTTKYTLQQWCISRGLDWLEDVTNLDPKFQRNYIRHHLLPHALHVNPGLYKTVKKLVLQNLSP